MMKRVVTVIKFKHCLDLINIVKIWKMEFADTTESWICESIVWNFPRWRFVGFVKSHIGKKQKYEEFLGYKRNSSPPLFIIPKISLLPYRLFVFFLSLFVIFPLLVKYYFGSVRGRRHNWPNLVKFWCSLYCLFNSYCRV